MIQLEEAEKSDLFFLYLEEGLMAKGEYKVGNRGYQQAYAQSHKAEKSARNHARRPTMGPMIINGIELHRASKHWETEQGQHACPKCGSTERVSHGTRHRYETACAPCTRIKDRKRGLTPKRKADTARKNREYRETYGWRKYVHGITEAEYDTMVDLQDGKCASCHREPPQDREARSAILHVDHDHNHPSLLQNDGRPLFARRRDAVRQLLCWGCNIAIGACADDPSTLRACADYLDAMLH